MEFKGKRVVIGTLLDITERKRAEQALKKADEALEDRVKEHTAELRATTYHLQQEIAERKRAEEALRKSEKRYRDLLDNANDIVFTYDLTGRMTWMNKAAERVSGYTLDRVRQLGLDHVVPEHRDLARHIQEKKCNGLSEVTTYEVDIFAKGGQRVSLEVCTQLIFENGKPAEVLGIARDITKRQERVIQ